ncbi:MAG: hypothetical protein V1668_02705 [Patescibacteria group bacterium]
MHQIRPFLRSLREDYNLECFPGERQRIAYIHGCLKDLINDENIMVVFTMEYLKKCGEKNISRNMILRFLERLSVDTRINSSIDVLIRKGILSENKNNKHLQLVI